MKKSNNSEKIPFFIHDDNKIIYFAGVYNEIGCSIITKEASPSLANIHHRQPLILGKKKDYAGSENLKSIILMNLKNFNVIE